MVSWLTMFPEEWDYAVPMQLILNGRDGYFASARQMNTNGLGKCDACWISRNMYDDRWSDQIMAPPKANFLRGSLVTVIWGSSGQSELVNARDILLTFWNFSGKPHCDRRQLVYNKAIWVATLGFEPNESDELALTDYIMSDIANTKRDLIRGSHCSGPCSTPLWCLPHHTR